MSLASDRMVHRLSMRARSKKVNTSVWRVVLGWYGIIRSGFVQPIYFLGQDSSRKSFVY